nr:MAG TPA: hypothetical protein [Caudoviricetes sp.]
MAKKDDYFTQEDFDRASYGGSVYDQNYFTNDELRRAAEVRAAAEAGTTSWDDAHRYVEDIRKQYGYSGDTNGGAYLPFGERSGNGFSGQQGGGFSGSFSYDAAPEYVSRYQDQINSLSQEILGRAPFSYDYNNDPNYQQYAESYTKNGQRAMQDTLGQMAARTGGLASSYAGSAAQQSYNNYMSDLAAKIPELYQLAYSMYQDEGDRKMDQLSMLQALENNDYARYNDLLSQYNNDRNFQYGAWRDSISDSRYADETAYDRNLNNAQLLASAGDFSGYSQLGMTEEQLNNLRNAYEQSLYASKSSGKSSGGKSSSGTTGEEKPRLTSTQARQAYLEDGIRTPEVISAYKYYYGDAAADDEDEDAAKISNDLERWFSNIDNKSQSWDSEVQSDVIGGLNNSDLSESAKVILRGYAQAKTYSDLLRILDNAEIAYRQGKINDSDLETVRRIVKLASGGNE